MNAERESLYRDIQACGYFPDLVSESVDFSLGDEQIVRHVVHHEATFAHENIQRHLTVLVVTPTRLLIAHTDEADDVEGPKNQSRAASTVESIRLDRITNVAVTRVVANPEQWKADQRTNEAVLETWLTVGWGSVSRIDLEPAACADPDCVADHGLSGQFITDDLTVRVSTTADGSERVRQLVELGAALQLAAGKA